LAPVAPVPRAVVTRTAQLARFEHAAREADAMAMVLRLAVEDLRENEDDEQVANVIRFAANHSARLAFSVWTAMRTGL
jgi:hypothetical protein